MPLLLAPHCRQPSKSRIPNSKSELPPPPQLSKSRQRRTASLISYSRRHPRLTHRIYLSIYCDHKMNTHIYTCQQRVSECLGNYLDFFAISQQISKKIVTFFWLCWICLHPFKNVSLFQLPGRRPHIVS